MGKGRGDGSGDWNWRIYTAVYTRFPGGTVVKNAGDARDTGSIPGSGRSPGIGNRNPL